MTSLVKIVRIQYKTQIVIKIIVFNVVDKMDGSIDPDETLCTNKEKTYSNQDKLPPLPVPDLGHTLDRYLDSGRNTQQYFKNSQFFFVSNKQGT